jgi:low temperature requirement protein LtrA
LIFSGGLSNSRQNSGTKVLSEKENISNNNANHRATWIELFYDLVFVGKLHSQFAPHISHLPERMGLFTIIVLGESILGVEPEISNMEFGLYSMLILGISLNIPFSLWWLYFDSVDGIPIRALR